MRNTTQVVWSWWMHLKRQLPSSPVKWLYCYLSTKVKQRDNILTWGFLAWGKKDKPRPMSVPISYGEERKLTIEVTIKTQVEEVQKRIWNHACVSDPFQFQMALRSFEIKSGLPRMSVIPKSRPSRTFKVLKLHDCLLHSMVSLINPSQLTQICLKRWIALHSYKILEDGVVWSFSFALRELHLEEIWFLS